MEPRASGLRVRRLLFTLLFAATAIAQPIRQEKSLTLYTPPASTRSEPPTARVRALIRQLAAPNPDARAAAERELLSLCPAIEPQLRFALAEEEKSAPAPLPVTAPLTQVYVRGGSFYRFEPADLLPRAAFHSLQALLERCGELRHTKPALVTINATNAPLAGIFRQLGEQTGAPVNVVARSDYAAVTSADFDWFESVRATVRLHRVPYWSALRTILSAISPPARGTELFVNIGSNHIRLIPVSPDSADIFRNPDAVSAGPMLLLASHEMPPQPQVTITAVLDPALTGFTGDSSLQLASVTDAQGHSLLGEGEHTSNSAGLEDKDFDAAIGFAFNSADGQFSWRQSIPIQASDSGRVAAVAGTFGIGFGVNRKDDGLPEVGRTPFSQHIGIPLAPFHPESLAPKPAEEQIYVLQDCKILQPPSVDKPVYEQDHRDCAARLVRFGDSERVEGSVLTLTNHRDHPVTYVAGLTYFDDPAPGFPKPDQIVAYTGIYHAHAEPGQTVEIRMATAYQPGTRVPIPPIPDRLPAPPSTEPPQTVVCDGWRVSVLSVSRAGEIYEIAGQVVMPPGAPYGETGVGVSEIPFDLNPLDAQGWQIESYPHFSRMRREGDRLVEDFTVATREPGRIPASLLWQTPQATHWLSSPVKIRHQPVGKP